jgi:ABC-type Na+ efflux pump permease subunit
MMNTMKKITDTFYIAWTIGAKDIVDALKNKGIRINLVIMLGMVVFFYWLSDLRPFDKGASVVVYDEGNTSLTLDRVKLGDGSTYTFRQAASLQEMERKMANQDLGLVIPADFDQILASGGEANLTGYIFWAQRTQTAKLEAKYTQAFTEILGRPVRVDISQDLVIPQPDVGGMETSKASNMLFFIFWTAFNLVPFLMLEERQTKTIDALLVSPASPGQVVLGKALAGLFYIVIVGGLAFALNWAYITNWGLALLAFLAYALLSIGVALVLGSFIKSPQQLSLWAIVFVVILIVPSLFYMEPNLKAGLRAILYWLPGSALATLFRFSCSAGIQPALLWQNLVVAAGCITVVFALVIWQVRRSDR